MESEGWMEVKVLQNDGKECKVALYRGQDTEELSSMLGSVCGAGAGAVIGLRSEESPVLPLSLVSSKPECLDLSKVYQVLTKEDNGSVKSDASKEVDEAFCDEDEVLSHLEGTISSAPKDVPVVVVFIPAAQQWDVVAEVRETARFFPRIVFLCAPGTILEMGGNETLIQVYKNGSPFSEGKLSSLGDLAGFCENLAENKEQNAAQASNTKDSMTLFELRLTYLLQMTLHKMFTIHESSYIADRLEADDGRVVAAFEEFDKTEDIVRLQEALVEIVNHCQPESVLKELYNSKRISAAQHALLMRLAAYQDPELLEVIQQFNNEPNVRELLDSLHDIIDKNEPGYQQARLTLQQLFDRRLINTDAMQLLQSKFLRKDPTVLGILSAYHNNLEELTETLELILSPAKSAEPIRGEPLEAITQFIQTLQMDQSITAPQAKLLLRLAEKGDLVIAAAHSLYNENQDWRELKDTLLRRLSSVERRLSR